MTIKCNIDRSNNLTTFVVYGEVTAEDMIAALRSVYQESGKPPTQNILWDYREGAPNPLIRNKDIEKMVSYLSDHTPERGGGLTAIVARADLEFDISKKYEFFTQLKGLSTTVEVFRTLGEAMIWLNSNT